MAEVIFLKPVCCLEKERVKFEKVICPTIWRANKIVGDVCTVEAVNRGYNMYRGNIYKDVLCYVQWRINTILARKTPFISPLSPQTTRQSQGSNAVETSNGPHRRTVINIMRLK